MWSDSLFVFLVIMVTAAIMASNRLYFDSVALLLSGTLTVGEALAGLEEVFP